MKVFHIFVICVSKWQQENTPTSKHSEKIQPLTECVIENIIEHHNIVKTMNLEDDCQESENIINIPWYILNVDIIIHNYIYCKI